MENFNLEPVLRFLYYNNVTAVNAFPLGFLKQLISQFFKVDLNKVTPCERRHLCYRMREDAEYFRNIHKEGTLIEFLQYLQQNLYHNITNLRDACEPEIYLIEINDEEDDGFYDTVDMTWHNPHYH